MTREDRYFFNIISYLRYNRAIANGLNPPSEIKNYLNTKPHPHA